MNTVATKKIHRARRHSRVRAKITGTSDCPRFAVYRSNRYLYAQLINDEKGVTLCALDSRKVEGTNARERAQKLGVEIAALAKKAGIEKVVFDRGGFLYTGSIKEVADSARNGGLQF